MLRENGQMKLSLSPYQGLYDIVVPKEHLLRKIKENVDFSFVNPMLRKQYCENFGRPAKEPEMMFKLLFMKKLGHKTPSSTFYGYKSHIAMTEERIITGIEVTHGGASDCSQLPTLLEKSIKNGIKVKEAIGDMAYVSEANLTVCEEKGVTLFARTNSAVAAAAAMQLDEGFHFNKDAGLLQCPTGELAMRVEKRNAQNGNTYLKYIFSKVKCKKCPLREQCRIGKSKGKEWGYSITQPSEKNQARLEFEASEAFRTRIKIRQRIEEKNGEMKVAHGLDRADSMGLVAMRLQTYFTAFVVNVKRIVTMSTPIPA